MNALMMNISALVLIAKIFSYHFDFNGELADTFDFKSN